MSVLNGKISREVIYAAQPSHGRRLGESAFVPLGGCMDVALYGDSCLVAACRRELKIFDISGMAPVEVSSLTGLGESRQMAISGRCAYITARADGLYVCDLSDIQAPKLCARIDTLELATGVAVCGKLLCVTNRHMGVEVWDVSSPASPVFLSDFQAGEAQSVYLDGETAYTGDWMNKTVHIHSLADPYHPKELSSFAVDGFADGVYVRDGLCYAATGHHAARLKNRNKYDSYRFLLPEMLADGYGCGHGFELFDVTDPCSPEYLSSLKLPPFYGGTDTWRITSDGERAYICDSHNGFFCADVTAPTAPRLTGYFRLPVKEQNPENTPPTIQRLCKAVCGAAASDGRLFLAGPESGLHVVDLPEAVRVPEQTAVNQPIQQKKQANGSSGAFFACGAQVHTVAFSGDTVFAACGEAGLYALDAADRHTTAHVATPGLCHDVCCVNGTVYTAEGQAGVAAYGCGDGLSINEICRLGFEGRSAREVTVTGNLVYAELGNSQIAALTFDGAEFRLLSVCSGQGMLYHRQLCRETASGLLCACPLSVGPALFELTGDTLSCTGMALGRQVCPIEEGAAACNEGLILIIGRNYLYLENPRELAGLDKTRFKRVEGARLAGIPFVCGARLLLLDRCAGVCELLDIAKPSEPRFIGRTVLPGHPEYAAEYRGKIWVACGHAGIFVL